MVKAYRALNLPQMADSTYAILQASYPQSKELRDLNSRAKLMPNRQSGA
jgi:outer membrane protein assembly factor BamD (BamD/ComL family)